MKFTGTTLTINPSRSAMVIDSGYDSFGKNITIIAPEGWTAIITQNGVNVANSRGTFKLASKKYSRKNYGGVKFPLFGSEVKARILFIRHSISGNVVVDKKVNIGGKAFTWWTNFSYGAEFRWIDKFLRFMKDLKLKPGEGGVMMTTADFSYVIETVFPGYLKVGDVGSLTGVKSAQQKAYLSFLDDAFTKKVLQPIGWEGTRFFPSYFRIS